jgi:hypothetical protein
MNVTGPCRRLHCLSSGVSPLWDARQLQRAKRDEMAADTQRERRPDPQHEDSASMLKHAGSCRLLNLGVLER